MAWWKHPAADHGLAADRITRSAVGPRCCRPADYHLGGCQNRIEITRIRREFTFGKHRIRDVDIDSRNLQTNSEKKRPAQGGAF